MIIRVFRAHVHDGKQAEFERFFLTRALPMVQSHAGVVSVTVGRPLATSPDEFLMISVWRDLDALRGFAGEEWQNPVIDPDEVHLLRETFLDHFELVGTSS